MFDSGIGLKLGKYWYWEWKVRMSCFIPTWQTLGLNNIVYLPFVSFLSLSSGTYCCPEWYWEAVGYFLAWYLPEKIDWLMSGDTHFLWLFHHLFLPLCYLLLHLPILFLNNIYNHLQASLSISEYCVNFPFTFFYSPFFYSFIHFSNISVRQTPQWTLPVTPMSIFIFISYVTMSHLLHLSWFLWCGVCL